MAKGYDSETTVPRFAQSICERPVQLSDISMSLRLIAILLTNAAE